MRQQLAISRMLIHYAHSRAIVARAQGRSQLGASAVEWAIISAVVVTLALGVYKVIQGVVQTRSAEISTGG